MLDSDFAALYEVELRSLNQAVKRNLGRFPEDFMFQLTKDEWDYLRSQNATSNEDTKLTGDEQENLRSQNVISKDPRGGRRYTPYAFTEQGVSMLSSVINSERAIEVNINIMRAFVKLRHYVLDKSDTNGQIAELRKLLMVHIENTDYKLSKHDKTIEQIIIALNNLIDHPPKTKRIGFTADD